MTNEQKRRVVLRVLTVVDTSMPARHHRGDRETQKHIEELMRQYDESLNVTKEVYKHG